MNIQILVDCRYGEESCWVSSINEEEFNLLNPLLVELEKRGGYFPTDDYLEVNDPTPEELYGSYVEGFRILKSILPTPTHGFGKINEIHVFNGEEAVLYL